MIPAPEPEPRHVAAPSRAGARAVAASKPTHVTGPRELFELARGQWRRGLIQEAADTYQALLTEYPRDGRAGLAAFELGRLRMDRLGDLRGAVQALERAVALAPGSEFREDAMARLVAANAGAHDMSACARARDQYLADFPSGVHRRTVAAACR
jgi:TolA-binding protein